MAASSNKGKQSTRDALSTFVPQTMKWILQQETNLKVPYSKQFPSVALFADISGFTNLTEKLSSLPGTIGVETLADEINNYLTLIIKQIVGSGGDIFKFAGDALLCVWPPDKDEMEDYTLHWKNLSTTILRVIRCALSIQKTIGQMSKCGVKELTLRVKLGIGVGNVDVLVVGGIMDRFENLPAGQAFFEAFNCENDHPVFEKDEAGKVIISEKCYHMCKKFIKSCYPVGDIGNYIVEEIRPLGKIGKRNHLLRNNLQVNMSGNKALFKKFSRYIPSAVVPHLKMPEQAWVGELRQVTIMFLSLPFDATDIKNIQESQGRVLKDIHDAIRSLQSIIYKYQGSLNKFLVDDKGSTVMAVFGLPPVAHRNDPERAVMAALDLRTEFNKKYTKNLMATLGGAVLDANKTQAEYDRDKSKDSHKGKKNKKKDKKKDKDKDKDKNKSSKDKHKIAIGITSGIVYLGLVGGAGSRREYSVLGDKVNLAARLMGLCKKKPHIYGEIAVDESITEKVNMKHLMEWHFIGKTRVKGKKQEIFVSKPVAKKFTPHCAVPPTAWLTDASDRHYITECSKVIEKLHEKQRGRIVFVEGEAGLGKAALIRRVMDQTKNRIFWLWGKGSWFHETKEEYKFPVWKQILLSFERKYPFYEEKNRNSFERYIKNRRPDLKKWLFLLSYFDLISFISPNEYNPKKHIPKEKKDKTALKLKGTIWERNEKAVQELKDKIQRRMEIRKQDDIRKFEKELEKESDEKMKEIKRKQKHSLLKKEAESKMDKKIGNFIYDVVLCLLEWAGGKLQATKPIAVVIDGLQWLRIWDWSLTRRLCLMLDQKILKHVTLFISSTPMDIKRYTPHYIRKYYVPQYKEMRKSKNAIVIVPAAWGIQKTKKYVKSYFKHEHSINVRDVSPKFVETVHSQCGGRPGFCKEFLDILKQKDDQNRANKNPPILQFADMRYKGEKKLSFSTEFEEHLSSKTQYSSIPIPPVVQAITARHLDVLEPEAMLCLKTAATICIAKGTRCLSFLKSTLKGSHPIRDFVTPSPSNKETGGGGGGDEEEKNKEERIDKTLRILCEMKFITKLDDLEDISHFVDINGDGHHHQQKKTLPCQLYKQSSMINNTTHGHLEQNGYTTGIGHHKHNHHQTHRALRNGSMDTSIKGRYGGGINNVVNRNKMHDSLSDGSAFGLGHLRSLSTVSQSAGSEIIDDEMKNSNMQDDSNRERRGENMPPTADLIKKPFNEADLRKWNKGVLVKSKGGIMNKGSERVFVFKNRTLYWFRNINIDKYPLGRIKFDESILRLQLNEKKWETVIKVSRKKYVLRSTKGLDDIKKWFTLFQTAMNSELNKRGYNGGPKHIVDTTIDYDNHDDDTAKIIGSYPDKLGVADKSIIDEENSMNFDPSIGTDRQRTVPLKQENGTGNNDYSAVRSQSMPEQSITDINGQKDNNNHINNSIMSISQLPDFSANTGECYEFTHGFLRDAIYEQMLFTQRIRIHNCAQKYLRKVLQAISSLPEYPTKSIDTRDYNVLLTRHEAIARNYQTQQNNIGPMVTADAKKPRRHRLPNFVGLN